MNELIQGVIVLLIVLWSIWIMMRRYFPQPIHDVQQRLANYCRQHQFVGLANYLMPTAPAKAGCDSGCSSCPQSCSSTPQNKQVVKLMNKM